MRRVPTLHFVRWAAIIFVVLSLIGMTLPLSFRFHVWVKLHFLGMADAKMILVKDLPMLPKELPNDLSLVAVVVKNREIIATVDRESFLTPFGLGGQQQKLMEQKFVEADWDTVEIMRNIRLGSIYMGILWTTALAWSAWRARSQLSGWLSRFCHRSANGGRE